MVVGMHVYNSPRGKTTSVAMSSTVDELAVTERHFTDFERNLSVEVCVFL